MHGNGGRSQLLSRWKKEEQGGRDEINGYPEKTVLKKLGLEEITADLK